MEALFFNFSKRRNSTKVPEDSSGTSFELYLKQDTSLRNPTFVISADTFGFNYCKFNGAYYFVTDVISHKNDLWYVVCEIDDLATLRAEILASSAYVLYDSVGNSDIIDERLAVTTVPSVQSSAVAMPGVDATIGRYILTVVGKESCSSWAIPYRMNPTAIVNSVLYQNIFDLVDEPLITFEDESTDIPSAIQAATELRDKMYQWFGKYTKKATTQTLASGNALDAIRGCIWLPFDFTTDSTDTGIIWLGNFETGFAATKLGTVSNPAVKNIGTVTVNIPHQFNDFRRSEPYTKTYLYIPFIGIINLSSSSLIGASSLSVTVALNVISGDLAIRVSCGSQTIGTYGSNVASPVPLGNSQITPAKMLNSIAGSTIVGALAGGTPLSGAAALSGVISTAANLTGHPTCIGGLSSGAAAGLLTNIVCFTVAHDTVMNPASVAATIGRPSFAVKTLSNVSGYVQTAEFSLQADAEGPALDAVNAALNGGAFIE